MVFRSEAGVHRQIKNEQLGLRGDHFQRMGLGLRASRRTPAGGDTRSFDSGTRGSHAAVRSA